MTEQNEVETGTGIEEEHQQRKEKDQELEEIEMTRVDKRKLSFKQLLKIRDEWRGKCEILKERLNKRK